MDEPKQTNPPASDAGTGAQTAARREEATSTDTLSELQKTQTDSPAYQSATSASSDSAPSPDGTPDNTGDGTADGRDSGGPM